jgi:serine/threonine-protein kinase
VYDDGETADGLVYLVMDLLEGQTLDARLEMEKTLPAREVLAITRALLDILAAAHDEGIVHRDVKPANIFITHRGAVRLLDFGIAHCVGAGHAPTSQWGGTMGTLGFMPPEQARGQWEPVDARTDLWAVGATMFTALTGREVHGAGTANEELVLAMTERAPSLGSIVSNAPRLLVNLVDRALAFDPSERWPDARAMQAALRLAQVAVEPQPVRIAAADDEGRRVVRDTARSHLASLRSRRWLDGKRRGIWAGAAAFAVAFVGSTGWAPASRPEAASAIGPPTTLQPGVDLDASSVDARASEAEASVDAEDPDAQAPSRAASANNEIRGASQVKGNIDEQRKARKAPFHLATSAWPGRVRPLEGEASSRRK